MKNIFSRSTTIKLPAVKSVHLDFDVLFIRKCLKKNTLSLEKLNWPEAIKLLYKKSEEAENKLLHVESVCRVAREESIIPFKKRLETLLLSKGEI